MNTKQETTSEGVRVTLCGGSRCCPTVLFKAYSNEVVIQDDHGGVVTMNREQARLLKQQLQEKIG